MRFFNFWKKGKILDLSNYKKNENLPNPEKNSDEVLDLSNMNTENLEDKKKRFAKRISELTTTIENLSNQIYHLQQRVELLEQKLNISHIN